MGRWLILAAGLAALITACDRKPAPRPVVQPPPPIEAPPEPKFGGQRVQDTGAIMFVCNGSGKHEEKEVIISVCPNCSNKDYFVAFENKFYCYKCEKELPSDKIKCDECGFVPKKTRIKHR